MKVNDRRLIEDYLPLDVINAIAGKEKKHPKHPVALVHYWPARRPITASRAAIYAALVPAPKSDKEREEAAAFVAKLAAFKIDPKILKQAVAQIRAHNGGDAPRVLDMFAGGGAIPLEAARLGCESHAVDYNPVAHIIELCTLVYPQTFGMGLAKDVERWGNRVMDRVKAEVEDLYPAVTLPKSKVIADQLDLFGGNSDQVSRNAEPVSYIWAKTVPCRRPGCPAQVPLVQQSWLRKKGGAIASVPKAVGKNKRLQWEIVAGQSAKEIGRAHSKQTGSGQATCVACSTPVPSDYVKEMSIAGRMSEVLAAVVVDGWRSKLYLPPDTTTTPDPGLCATRLEKLLEDTGFAPLDELMNTEDSTTIAGRGYGISRWRELFTPRQLLVLFTLVKHIRQAHKEMLEEGLDEERTKAVTTFLAMAFGRLVNSFTKFCRWQGQDQKTIAAIGDRQALKMIYDFSEINPFAKTAGCLPFAIANEAYCIRELSKIKSPTAVSRGNAEKLFFEAETFDAVVTDPPYYSSIYYADLSAFFYVWLRRMVGDLYPEHFTLPGPPKRREAVAQPSEHDGDSEKAEDHYRTIMEKSFVEARRVLKPGAPLVCVYAHKTTEGWATLIKALMNARLTVTEAWPVQTEARGRTNALEAAALSDSIFFVARRRQEERRGEYETEVQPELEHIARERVKTLWAGGKGIAGADLLMAAVGAGLRAYTRFATVEYQNGEPVSPEVYLRAVEGVVQDVMFEEIFGMSGTGVTLVDKLTRFYVLWRFTYKESPIEAGDVYVFCYPLRIDIDGPEGLAGPSPDLVEKKSTKFRVRNYEERGEEESLGLREDGIAAPLIDALHRLLWLMENRPREIPGFIKKARPNLEQLRIITQALCGPVLMRPDAKDATPTPELSMLTRLRDNWQSVVEGADVSRDMAAKVRGQLDLDSGGK